ncbi:ABC transporter ATP-binding protein [Pseudonocardia nigra]|uniref:ABC transporter ATP-binding protein n=1 Tax=Pseudonocardia nigra TaxID=1921578 RepID=UPI001C602B12|nr:ATP-binding cassette domain-containing protein [Pseudonocardia nigra]
MLRNAHLAGSGSAGPRAHGEARLVCLDRVDVTVQRTPVLRRLDLELRPGEVLGVLGANGSGKTTLLHLLATLIAPSAGGGHVLGAALGASGCAAVRPRIGLIGHQPALYPQLTLAENLQFVARLTGRTADAADRALTAVGLAGAAQRRADRCSQGMLRRTELARVLLTEPLLLLLNEVHAGLDSAATGLVDEVVRRVRERGGGCVLVSHEPDRLTGLADRLVRVLDGRAVPVPSNVERSEARR